MSGPKVTIAFPTYRARPALFLPALEAALAQTFTDREVIVVDDGSDDEVLRAAAERGATVHRNAERQGLAGNWNRCVELARGELVNVAHQDDLMAPTFLARAVAALDAAPRAGFAHTAWRSVDETGAPTGERWEHLELDHLADFVRDGRDYFQRIVTLHTPVCCPTAVYRRAALLGVGGFDRAYGFAADLDLFLRITLDHDVAYVHEVLYAYRRHAGSTTSQHTLAQMNAELLRAKRDAVDLAARRGLLPPAAVARLRAAVAREGLKKARKVAFDAPAAALREVRNAARLRPLTLASENGVVAVTRAAWAMVRQAAGLPPGSRSARRPKRGPPPPVQAS
ncbi:MAG: glycosyltransferase [Planctomycetes bacterium]|nr:glycosyltransferase [Planctomycetota bacterium]